MGWQVSLDEAKRQAAERAEGKPELWWVTLDEPTDTIWVSTPAAGEGWSLCAFARTLYADGTRFSVDPTSDPKVARVTTEAPVGAMVCFEDDMPAVMRTLRAYGHHGAYRKAGTTKEYRF